MGTLEEREELFGLICGRTTLRAVERILAAGYSKPRTVSTVAELDALAEGTVLLDAEGGTSVRTRSGWRTTIIEANGEAWITVPLEDAELPATVLYTPDAPTETGTQA